MSKLSELIPAGGSAKELSAVASGTLPNGRAVILKDNGQVEVVNISDTTYTESSPAGAEYEFNSGDTGETAIAWDSNSTDTFVVIYKDKGNSNYGTAVVGIVTGTSIAFGAEQVFRSGYFAGGPAVCFHPDVAGKFVAIYSDGSGRAIVGTVSGTSISFQSPVTFNSSNMPYFYISFDPNTSGRFVIGYHNVNSNSNFTVISGLLSGNSLSFGSEVAVDTGTSTEYNVAYDPNVANKFVTAWTDNGSSYYGKSRVGTVSGNSISLGTPYTFRSNYGGSNSLSFDPSVANSFIVAYSNTAVSNKCSVKIGTVSGTNVSMGSSTEFSTGTADTPIARFNPRTTTGKFIIVYKNASSRIVAVTGTKSGSSLSVGNTNDYASTISDNHSVEFSSNVAQAGKFAISYEITKGIVRLGQLAATASISNLTSTNFVGFASEAISSGATGVINPVGGVAASVSNLAPASVGTPVTVNAASSSYFSAVFDSENNKIVIAYKDGGNSNYGTAIVGTVSGSSISYGSPVVFRSASSNYNSVAFDSNSNKVVVAYEDQGGTINGNSNVGTVSGTSISFGSVSEFYSARPQHVCSVFDSNSNKIVIAYSDIANSYYGTAIIGTVSGTTISYGSPVIFETSRVYDMTIAFDDNANKVVISYRDIGNSNYGTAIVGTVSGTSISFGTAVIFKASATSRTSTVYDSTANKIVLAYCDETNSFYGTAIVGTVSGTSISFGSAVVWNSSDFADVSTVFNADNNKVILSYKINGGSGGGKVIEGTVSGNSISFSSPLLFDQQANSQLASAFDSNSNKVLIAYKESIASHGKSVVYTSGISAFTIGSTYYVQSDGTVSTVSTSPAVNAGKAISATSLLLKG